MCRIFLVGGHGGFVDEQHFPQTLIFRKVHAPDKYTHIFGYSGRMITGEDILHIHEACKALMTSRIIAAC